MKILTTEQLAVVVEWFRKCGGWSLQHIQALPLMEKLITAECREHGYAGIKDAYRVLIEGEGK